MLKDKVTIEVLMNTEHFNNKDMYFYCVFVGDSNSGICGWCETPEQAFAKGLKRYKQFLESDMEI